MRKIYSKRVANLLTVDQKQQCVIDSADNWSFLSVILLLDMDSQSEKDDLAAAAYLLTRQKSKRNKYLRLRSVHGEFKLCQKVLEEVFHSIGTIL